MLGEWISVQWCLWNWPRAEGDVATAIEVITHQPVLIDNFNIRANFFSVKR